VFTGAGSPAPDVPSVLGETRVEGGEVVFEPRFPFVPGLAYLARLRLPERAALEHAFEVEAPAGEPPRVLDLFPSGDSLPANALRLYVRFSQPMDVRGAPRCVRLLDESGREVALAFVEIEHGLWDPRQTRLTLLFHPGRVKRGVGPGERLGPPLREGGAYRLVVDAALRDARGQPLAAPFERAFRVGPADRLSPRIEDLRLEAPPAPEASLLVTLPEPLDEGLLHRLLWVESAAGERIEGSIEVGPGETLWRFRPSRPWRPGAYALRVHPALEDRAGNRFDRLFDRSWPGSAAPAESPTLQLPFEVAPQPPR
jgi:hypothetical protein